ncbi:MAG: thiamine ABC transporter substrate-binding protein [Thermoplasmata archaeon]
MTGSSEVGGRRRQLRSPGRVGRVLLVVAIVLVAGVAGAGIVGYVVTTYGEPILVVYTYPSLFGGPGSSAYAAVFDTFAAAHHVRLDVEFPSGNLVGTLLAEANAPAADLVIGLDEITGPEAEAHGLLLPYAPPELANVSPPIAQEISADHGVVPYEWGYLAIDYNETSPNFYRASGGAVANATFPDFATNSSWANQLLIEDPTVDITGEEFLVWQIEYYEQVLHQNWTTFWKGVLPHLTYKPAPDWGTAFGEFSTPPGNPGMVVSYSTDPAYAAYYGDSGQFNSTVSWWNGTEYGWRTVYGVGIVSGSRHVALDEELEEWLLSGTVQAMIPTSEWEYPANTTVTLPAVFGAALDPSAIVPLNDGTTPAAVRGSLNGWLTTYEELADQLLPP